MADAPVCPVQVAAEESHRPSSQSADGRTVAQVSKFATDRCAKQTERGVPSPRALNIQGVFDTNSLRAKNTRPPRIELSKGKAGRVLEFTIHRAWNPDAPARGNGASLTRASAHRSGLAGRDRWGRTIPSGAEHRTPNFTQGRAMPKQFLECAARRRFGSESHR